MGFKKKNKWGEGVLKMEGAGVNLDANIIHCLKKRCLSRENRFI